jgi:hypothetical protein
MRTSRRSVVLENPMLGDNRAWPWPKRIQRRVLRREGEATILDAAFPTDPFAP